MPGEDVVSDGSQGKAWEYLLGMPIWLCSQHVALAPINRAMSFMIESACHGQLRSLTAERVANLLAQLKDKQVRIWSGALATMIDRRGIQVCPKSLPRAYELEPTQAELHKLECTAPEEGLAPSCSPPNAPSPHSVGFKHHPIRGALGD